MAITSSVSKKIGRFIPKTGWKDFDAMLNLALDKPMALMEIKAKMWAEETLKEWKKNVPVDTGNLRDSIEIDNHLKDGYIIVGVNEQKLIGPKKLRSGGSKIGAVRNIPPYNYVPAAEKNAKDVSLRFFVEKIWFEIARQKAEEFFR